MYPLCTVSQVVWLSPLYIHVHYIVGSIPPVALHQLTTFVPSLGLGMGFKLFIVDNIYRKYPKVGREGARGGKEGGILISFWPLFAGAGGV